jgi:magnesium transporter
VKKFSIGNHQAHKPGISPGTLIFSGERKMDAVSIRVMTYNLEQLEESIVEIDQISTDLIKPGCISWIDISGIHDAEIVRVIGEKFGLHALLLEDVMNTQQRPKLETYDGHIFIVVKMLDFIAHRKEVMEEQVAMILMENVVITFQEEVGDIFDQVRTRLRTGKGKIRGRKTDYLTYALLDAIVDEYFFILEAIGEELDTVEEELIHQENGTSLQRMQLLKRQIIGIRKHVWPTRELINNFARLDSDLVQPETAIFLRDVHDHVMQVSETIESYRDILSSIQDLYLSVVNNKMNEVMKVLAGISTIFLPMTLVAGIYGMNFDVMPELRHSWAYPASLGLMGGIGIVMYIYFRTRKWF